jgi:hypothetical protein
MQTVINGFNERVKEVDLYFRFLEKLEVPEVLFYFPQKRTHKFKEIEPDIVRMLKANAFLMIYNLVESSIRDGILEIYRQIGSNSYTYERVRKEIQDIWLRSNYRQIFNETATWESARKTAAQLVEEAINGTTIHLDKDAIPISGNLDARQIRRICKLHGISHQPHPRAKGGEKLLEVKNQRNALAHGDRSFAECGRDVILDDLKEIKSESIIFVRSILRNMMRYANEKQYAESANHNKQP